MAIHTAIFYTFQISQFEKKKSSCRSLLPIFIRLRRVNCPKICHFRVRAGMHINASSYHANELPRSLFFLLLCHADPTNLLVPGCYDILRQCIITPVKRAHGTLIQKICSTCYYSTASNSKTSRESGRRNA